MLAQNYQSKRCTLHGENIERIITTGRTSYKAIGWAVLLLSTLIGCLPSAQAVDVLFREKDELDQINFVLENHELSHPSFQQILSLTSSAEATSVAYGEVYSSNYNLSALEINALEDLYNATNGKSWNWRYPYDIYGQRWNFSTQIVNPCNDSWQGIVCGSSFGSVELHVKNLSLNSMGLSGVLPASISNLSELSVLNLNNNSLTGVFPDSVPSLANLTELILSSNNLTGPIPRNLLANLSQLRVLLLSENKLEGELFDIQEGYGAQLGLLSLEKNMLVDKFPENIKFLRNLELFTIGRNSFSGSIPESIGELKNLTVLGVNNNHLQGHLPSSIANCSRLEYLYAEENLFEGQIWQNIELLPNLVYISIYENSLTGPIPNGIGNLTQLRALVLDNNYFTGSIPTSIGNCTFLQQLTIYNNILTGELPPELSSLSYLELVLLQNNRFVGKPGPAFDRDRQLLLYSVDISQNDFTGVLPDSFFAPNLTSFAAFENCFAGKLPDAICNSGKLEVLVLDGIGTGRHCRRKYWPTIADSPYYTKAIEGAIPSCVWTDLPSLQTMHISGNGLTGEIPMLESYGNLTDLDLSYNRMSGEIPLQLQTWSQLTNLDLSNNRFCGEITGMSQLKYSYSTKEDGISLSLSINRLSGIIPTEIEYAQNIQIVSGNLFSCSYYHQPPIHDPDSTTYVCGSNLLDISLWFFSVGGGLWVLTVVFLLVSVGMVAKHLLFGSNLALASRSSTLVKDGDNQQTTSIHATILADKAEGVVESSNLNIWNRLCDLVYYYYYFFVLSSSTFIINQIHSLPDKSIGASALYLLYWWKFLDEVVSMDYCNIKYCAFDDRIEISPVSAENSCVRRVSIVQDLKLAKVSVELLQIAYGGKRSTHLCLLLKVIRLLRIVALIMVLLIILVTIPSYLALKKYFGTYANQYRWEISGAFLEGKESACFVLTAWIVLLAIVLTAIQRYIPNRKNPIHGENGAVEQSTTNSGIKNVSTYSSSTLDTPQTFTVKEKSDPSADSPVKDGAVRLGVSFDSKSLSALVEENSTNTITSRKSSSVLKFFEERRSKIGKMISRIKRRSWWIGIFALLLNSTVVMALKTSAIFLLVSSKSDFEVKLALECSISALDVVWMVILVPYMISRLPQVTQLGKFLLKVSMLFFNSLVAPSLAIAGTDSSCFQGLFKQQPNSEDVFYFSYCTFYLPGSSEETCYKSSSWSSVVYYRPPFYYNFSCYSAILTAYIPITFLSYTILSVSIPAVSWFLTTRKKPSAIHNCFPKIYLIENEASIEFNMLEETKEKESKYPADEVVKQDIESVSVKNAMHVQEQEFFDNLKGERCCECSLDENKISEQNNTIKETLSSEKSTSKAIESKRRSVLFYPNFILASMIHNILVIMTLGLMSPPLATAITLVLVSTSLTWEIVVGRYLSAHVMAAYKESTEHLKAGRARLRSTFTSEGTESANSVNSINSHRLRSDSSSEGDLLDNGKLFRIDELEHQCINIWCAPRKCMWLISYCSGVFYAFLLLDMLAGAEGLGDALWILAVCMALPALIVRTVQIFVKAQPPPISLIHESSEKMNNSLPAKESSIMAENEGIDSTMYRDTRNSFVEMPNVKSINIYLLNSTIRFPSINIFMYLMEITQHAQSSFFLTCLSSSLAH